MRKVNMRPTAKETPDGLFLPVIMTDEADVTINAWGFSDYELARNRAEYIINQVLDADPVLMAAQPLEDGTYSLWLLSGQKNLRMGILDSEERVEALGQDLLAALGLRVYRTDQLDPEQLTQPEVRVRSTDPNSRIYVKLEEAKKMVADGDYIVAGPGLIVEKEYW